MFNEGRSRQALQLGLSVLRSSLCQAQNMHQRCHFRLLFLSCLFLSLFQALRGRLCLCLLLLVVCPQVWMLCGSTQVSRLEQARYSRRGSVHHYGSRCYCSVKLEITFSLSLFSQFRSWTFATAFVVLDCQHNFANIRPLE